MFAGIPCPSPSNGAARVSQRNASQKIGAIRMRPASAGIALFASEDAEAVGASRKSEFRAVVMMKSPLFEVLSEIVGHCPPVPSSGGCGVEKEVDRGDFALAD